MSLGYCLGGGDGCHGMRCEIRYSGSKKEKKEEREGGNKSVLLLTMERNGHRQT
jgi:hypothetical protein